MQVTLEAAKSYLRVDSSDDDALISGLIVSAETLVREVTRLNDEELLPYKEIVEIAELFTIAYLYEHREEADHHGVVIPDEFCEGSFCSRLYEEIAKRKKKICEKLQVDEDLDLEHIINCMEDFTRYMSMKMYEYGALMDTKE